MSFSPSLSLVRLQELKLWQGSYENLIQKSKAPSKSANLEDLNQVLVHNQLSLTGSSSDCGEGSTKDRDKKAISPCKPFEEKLAEDIPMAENTKEKKPFLKKGQGLARFRMGTVIKNKELPPKKTAKPPTRHQQQPPSTPKKGILKKASPFYQQNIDLMSPLTIPDFVKPRGTWKSVFENPGSFPEEISGKDDTNMLGEEPQDVEGYEEFRKSLGYGEGVSRNDKKITDDEVTEEYQSAITSSNHMLNSQGSKVLLVDKKLERLSRENLNSFNRKLVNKISRYANRNAFSSRAYMSNNIPEAVADIPQQIENIDKDESSYEKKMERELRIFEELEKKVERNSFCSANSSVAILLASTPQKPVNHQAKNGNFHELDQVPAFTISEERVDTQEDLKFRLEEVVQKTDVLQHFLMNLKNMETKGTQEDISLDSELSPRSHRGTSTNTSWTTTEDTRWSTRSPSLADNCTDYETTCQSDSSKKIDAGVNTSFDCSGRNETVKNLESCADCEDLRLKLSNTKLKLQEADSENANLKTDIRSIERKYEQMRKEMKKSKKNYEDLLHSLQEELEAEKRRFAKEKLYFDNYVKDSQNRPTKKEREEITQLKQNLADTTELLKLKDTKHGATQARFRTQIKQQEKEISELKITIDKLHRDTAKLNANQKFMRRPQEVKMLHEINKNLSKLTEETLKKQMNKSEDNDNYEDVVERKKYGGLDKDKECATRENDKNGKDVNNMEVQKGLVTSNEGLTSNSAALDLTAPEDLALEKQYQREFGCNSVTVNTNVTANLDKSETILPDGSVEVSYGNGNVKTISADGHLIVIKYFNGDIKETDLRSNIIKYHYSAYDSWHTQYPGGIEVMEYKDGQKSKKYADGRMEVSYPDGSLRTINSDGTEEQQFPDGRKAMKNLQGEQIIMLPNGQKEIHTSEYKRREYPDGTIRTLRKDGSVETVYSNGRVRLKDSSGVLILDTHYPPQS